MIIRLTIDTSSENISYERMQQVKAAVRDLGHGLDFIHVEEVTTPQYDAELIRLRGH